ncbi:phospholipid scramblase 1 isoform X3 [Heterocephalus glaber]|uniref:Phospholipid scramblase n=1 Tax=Heterocephalus glaber TaxID=10181 RepID=A0AAX6SK90_HETGA|nr:phospholipid scramblase 1 isoform X3 [Heterocephalus glaber]
MDPPHRGANFPPAYNPQFPPAAFQGPPGQTGYSGPQGTYLGPKAGYPGPYSAYQGPPVGSPIPPGSFAGAGQPGFPVQSQPGYSQPGGPAGAPWMPAPPPPLNCPPGLEYLSQIDQILVHQQIELLEVLTGFETNNKYEIKNSLGQRVYFAVEDNDCCTRNCCGASRPFTLKILDNLGREVITMERPLRCTSCCFPCCLQEIKSLDEQSVVGKISKQWSGLVREAFTDADNFGIQFPLDLDVKIKTVMLGACFLVDFMFFESTDNQQQKSGVW